MIAPAYYRSLLSPDEQEAYKKIVVGLLHRRDCIHINQTQHEVIKKIVKAVHWDHPELFVYDFWSYRFTQSLLLNRSTLYFQPLMDSYEEAVVMTSLNAVAAAVLEVVRDSPTRECIYFKIAREIVSKTRYMDTGNTIRDHSVVGPVLFQSGVCEAISKMFLFLCQRAQVPCAMMAGSLNGIPHAWNMIELNGVRKYIDVTSVLQTISLYSLAPTALFKSEQALRRNGYDW